MATLYVRYPSSFGLTSLNGLTGAVTLAAGTGISITPSGNTLTIASTASGVTLTAFGSTPNANGASLSGQALTLQPADGTNPGGVSITTQTLAGAKTFSTSATSPAFISSTANVAATGAVRLANADAIKFRNAGNSADISLTVGSTDSIASYAAIDLANISSTQTLTNKTLTTPTVNQPTINGVSNGSSAATGVVGEYVTSFQTLVNAPATGVYGDLTSIALTAGDWDVFCQGEIKLNGATATEVDYGVSVTAGNNTTGLVSGDNFFSPPLPTSTANTIMAIPIYLVNVSSSTTVYFKMFAVYSAGNPQFRGRISARRRR